MNVGSHFRQRTVFSTQQGNKIETIKRDKSAVAVNRFYFLSFDVLCIGIIIIIVHEMDAFTGTYFQWKGNDTDLQCGVISGDEEEEEAVFWKN